MSASAALANIELIERRKWVENAESVGRRLFEGLLQLKRWEIIKDVRGRGLLMAVEFSDAFLDLKPNSRQKQRVTSVFREVELMGRLWPLLFVAPPLCLTEDEADQVLERLNEGFKRLQPEGA